jgi:hypothetical protein
LGLLEGIQELLGDFVTYHSLRPPFATLFVHKHNAPPARTIVGIGHT